VVAAQVVGEHGSVLRPAGVAERDERVPAQVAGVVPGDVEPVVPATELLAVGLEPVHERHVRLGPGWKRLVGPPALDAPVPGADVLADVAAVDPVAERFPVLVRNRLARLRPVREAPRRVERAGLAERARGAGAEAGGGRAAGGG